jgi:hypothetical protein
VDRPVVAACRLLQNLPPGLNNPKVCGASYNVPNRMSLQLSAQALCNFSPGQRVEYNIAPAREENGS